jgi:hypothetical protein
VSVPEPSFVSPPPAIVPIETVPTVAEVVPACVPPLSVTVGVPV